MQPYRDIEDYRWWVILALAILAPLNILRGGPFWLVLPVAIAIGACTWRRTIQVNQLGISSAYGFGWPKWSMAFADIRSVRIRRNAYDGVNQREFWPGRLAVEVLDTEGNTTTLGTDDPEGLVKAIERFRAA
jgi:hypothetical protein